MGPPAGCWITSGPGVARRRMRVNNFLDGFGTYNPPPWTTEDPTMESMRVVRCLALAVILGTGVSVMAAPAEAPGDRWATPAESSGYRTTPRYDETMAYLRRLAAAAPRQLKLER